MFINTTLLFYLGIFWLLTVHDGRSIDLIQESCRCSLCMLLGGG